jgi:FkbM family methyltransferase
VKYSQAGQDRWVLETLKKNDGFFVDVGAYDGVESSNSLWLEELGWKGICIEAGPDWFAHLRHNRPTTTNVNMAVMPYSGFTNFSGYHAGVEYGHSVPCAPLHEVLSLYMCPEYIDYLSIDIEGGEIGLLESMDWTKYEVNLITIEHNLYLEGPAQKDRIYELLSDQGFIRVVEDAPVLEPNTPYYMQPYEDWYQHADFIGRT